MSAPLGFFSKISVWRQNVSNNYLRNRTQLNDCLFVSLIWLIYPLPPPFKKTPNKTGSNKVLLPSEQRTVHSKSGSLIMPMFDVACRLSRCYQQNQLKSLKTVNKQLQRKRNFQRRVFDWCKSWLMTYSAYS